MEQQITKMGAVTRPPGTKWPRVLSDSLFYAHADSLSLRNDSAAFCLGGYKGNVCIGRLILTETAASVNIDTDDGRPQRRRLKGAHFFIFNHGGSTRRRCQNFQRDFDEKFYRLWAQLLLMGF